MAKFQPTLPPEVPLSDAELAFIDESPPGLFPDNQDSNFGFIIRKLFCDRVQELINQQNVIFAEHFVASSSIYLDEWERQVGLPSNPPGLSIQQRKNRITQKLRVGPFTRKRRDEIVQAFVQATLGDAVSLTPQGVDLSAGVPLFSGLTTLVGAYTITENISGYSFTITVAQGVTLDTAALTRELNRVVPAGISFTISTASQTFKLAGDTGFMSDSATVRVPNVFTVQDFGTLTETATSPSKTVIIVSEAAHGTDSALAGYGSGAYGSGSYGGVTTKITGTARLGLSPLTTPHNLSNVLLRIRARKTNALDAGVLNVWLYEGATPREGPYSITLQDTFTTDVHTLINAANISNWGNLEIRLQAIATNIGGNLTAQVSFVQLQAST